MPSIQHLILWEWKFKTREAKARIKEAKPTTEEWDSWDTFLSLDYIFLCLSKVLKRFACKFYTGKTWELVIMCCCSHQLNCPGEETSTVQVHAAVSNHPLEELVTLWSSRRVDVLPQQLFIRVKPLVLRSRWTGTKKQKPWWKLCPVKMKDRHTGFGSSALMCHAVANELLHLAPNIWQSGAPPPAVDPEVKNLFRTESKRKIEKGGGGQQI